MADARCERVRGHGVLPLRLRATFSTESRSDFAQHRSPAIVSFWLPPLPHEPDVRVVARWRDGRASTAEVAALRRLLPELRDRPVVKVFRAARAATEWVLAICHPAHARPIREQAERAGLAVVVEPVPTAGPVEDGAGERDPGPVTRAEAERRALKAANQVWGFPTATEELVILGDWIEESTSAWAFTYNTRSFAETGDIMRALAPGNGPVIVVKATGAVHLMPSAYSAREALRVFGTGR